MPVGKWLFFAGLLLGAVGAVAIVAILLTSRAIDRRPAAIQALLERRLPGMLVAVLAIGIVTVYLTGRAIERRLASIQALLERLDGRDE